jgi:hypothetical protein
MFVATGQWKTTIVPELQAQPDTKTPGLESDHQWVRVRWSPLTSQFYSCEGGVWTEHADERCNTTHKAIAISKPTVEESSAAQKSGHQPWRSDPALVAQSELQGVLTTKRPAFAVQLHDSDMKCEAIQSTKQLCYYWDKESGVSASIHVERFAPGIWFATDVSVTACTN